MSDAGAIPRRSTYTVNIGGEAAEMLQSSGLELRELLPCVPAIAGQTYQTYEN
ncbi:MAG TPA: hypothetical protein VF467_02780 [Afipia sp.]